MSDFSTPYSDPIINTYSGIAIVASKEKPQMRYKMSRVNRRPAFRSKIITRKHAGNSITEIIIVQSCDIK